MDTYVLLRRNEQCENTILLCDGCIEKKNINMSDIMSSDVYEMRQIQETLSKMVGIELGVLHYHNNITHDDYCSECYENLAQSQKDSLKPVIR